MKPKSILVCTDGSPLSDKAVSLAINLEKSLTATLTVFRAIVLVPAEQTFCRGKPLAVVRYD